jgi:multidrug efflux pump subunit AcrB
MQSATLRFVNLIKSDPAVQNVIAFTGGGGAANGGFIFMALKPLEERKIRADQIIARLRPKLACRSGRVRVFAGRTGFAHRRTAKQRAISIHDPKRKSG